METKRKKNKFISKDFYSKVAELEILKTFDQCQQILLLPSSGDSGRENSSLLLLSGASNRSFSMPL